MGINVRWRAGLHRKGLCSWVAHHLLQWTLAIYQAHAHVTWHGHRPGLAKVFGVPHFGLVEVWQKTFEIVWIDTSLLRCRDSVKHKPVWPTSRPVTPNDDGHRRPHPVPLRRICWYDSPPQKTPYRFIGGALRMVSFHLG